MKKVVIIGGGITGLTTAFYLQQQTHGKIDISLIEASPSLGGKISSLHEKGFVIEGGPDSFIAKKSSTLDLCRTLGLDDQVMGSKSAQRPTYVWSGGKLHPMPEGMMLMAPTMVLPFLRSKLISWPGKMRMGMEFFIPSSGKIDDESLASFVRRRLGSELLDKVAAPLMAGIYAADPETLSLQSTFPLFPEMEHKYGGLLRGMIRQKRQQKQLHAKQGPQPKRSAMFMTLRGGLHQLVDALLTHLHPESLLLNRRVTTIGIEKHRYTVTLSDGSNILADDVVLATPAYVTADIVEEMDPALASQLRAIRYVSTATVSLGFKRADITHPLDGYGFVVPFSAGRKITACTWSSQKFDNRAPDDCVLIRVFVGGARAENLAEQDEAALLQMAREELRITMGITAEPILAKAYRWSKSTPQYEVGHQSRIVELERTVARHPGLHLAGAAFHGAGIPDCIQSGVKVVQTIADSCRTNSNETFDCDTVPSSSVCTR